MISLAICNNTMLGPQVPIDATSLLACQDQNFIRTRSAFFFDAIYFILSMPPALALAS